MLHQTAATHQLGGTLDAVITREDVGCPGRVEVVDVGLSDHHLPQWSVDTTRPEVPAVVELRRLWRRLDVVWCMLSSPLCQPDSWPSDLDDMAAMYDHELNVLLDQLITARSITCRRRATDPWFDAECRADKRLTRRLERAYAAARRRHNTNVGHMAVSSATSAVTDSDAGSDAVVAAHDQRRLIAGCDCDTGSAGTFGQRRSSLRELVL